MGRQAPGAELAPRRTPLDAEAVERALATAHRLKAREAMLCDPEYAKIVAGALREIAYRIAELAHRCARLEWMQWVQLCRRQLRIARVPLAASLGTRAACSSSEVGASAALARALRST